MVDLQAARVVPRGEGGIAQRTLAGFLLIGSTDALPVFETVEANQRQANLLELLDGRLREVDPGAFGLLFTSSGEPYLLAWGSLVATIESPAACVVLSAQPKRCWIGRVQFGPGDDIPGRIVLAQDSSSIVTDAGGEPLAPDSAPVGAQLVEIELRPVSDPVPDPQATSGPELSAAPPAARDIVFADDLSPETAAALSAPSGPSTLQAPTLVLGTSCPAGHHNHPDAERCSQCGTALGGDQTKVLINGPRPSLGVLVVDDGTTYSLDHDIIIGREPGKHPDVLDGRAVPLALTDSSLSLSRRHARIVLDEWSVAITDLGSSNGTFISRDGAADQWEAVPSDGSLPVGPGDRLRVGGRIIGLEVLTPGSP